jgi:TetR/AcrR family tetracycline transcriptional repressor
LATKSEKAGGRRSLSRKQVIDAALAVLEEQGADALSLRRVAERLGVAPNALYTHVHGKEDLIDGLVDQVNAELDLDPGPSDEWMQQMVTLSQSIRTHLLAHPAVVPFALRQSGLGPHELRLGEAIFNVLRPAGFSDAGVVGTVMRCFPTSLDSLPWRPAARTRLRRAATTSCDVCVPSSPPYR